MPRKRLLLLVGVYLASVVCWAQDTPSRAEGGITGVVLTNGGQPATGARVCTSMRRGNSVHTNCTTTTDNEGQFTVKHLKAAAYQVFAINEAEGYSIQNQMPGQEVTIDANQSWPNVIITIRQDGRDGILIGSVTDKLTGGSSVALQYSTLRLIVMVGAATQVLPAVWQKQYQCPYHRIVTC